MLNLGLNQKNITNKKFLIYGFGLTGKSVLKFFKKKKIKKFSIVDDKIDRFKIDSKALSNKIRETDFIIMSPGVSIFNSKIKKIFNKSKKKIISDLDLFSIFYPKNELLMITGTNGKSTTCKMLEHILKYSKRKTHLGGNIGKPILNINPNKNSKIIVEASSFQLAYSKIIKPKYAAILNISNDHEDWHKNYKNYQIAKLKIFSNQDKKDYAYLQNNDLIRKFRKKNFKSKLIKINYNSEKYLSKKISNRYFNYSPNLKNFIFSYFFLKSLKIKDKLIFNSLKKFKGLSHRHEIFLKIKNNTFINDSKATSFDATKHALKSNKNIFWIVGGIPKKNDKILIQKFKQNVKEAFIIGKNIKHFKNNFQGVIKYTVSNNLKQAVKDIFKKLELNRDNTILLSPASASFDQFNNFEERGRVFKKYINIYAKKYL